MYWNGSFNYCHFKARGAGNVNCPFSLRFEFTEHVFT